MISPDLILNILQSIKGARDTEEKERLRRELRERIEDDIRALFRQYPNRRRTFGAIRDNLGIFDSEDRQEELKLVLYGMGARPRGGAGDRRYWHLPEGARGDRGGQARLRWSRVYALGLAGLLAYAAWTLLPPALLERCIARAVTFEDLETCHAAAP